MNFSLLVPHYGTGEMTAFCVHQLIKHRGRHNVSIVVIDNNAGDGSIKFLEPFLENITVVDYPKDRLQSHGIAFDFIIPHLNTDWFITLESDSYPDNDHWLDLYEQIIGEGFDAGGSLLWLSGGQYLHPCGAVYSKKVWEEAKAYCDAIEYWYFPNMAMKDGFASHLMVHKSINKEFTMNPETYIELSDSYKPYSTTDALRQLTHYSPVAKGPFHNGMGNTQESVKTYGARCIDTEVNETLLTNKEPLIYRVGAEPGQWFTYWMLASGKNVASVETEIKWLPNKTGQQQEYTLMGNGLRHIWGVSAYKDVDPTDEVARIKQAEPRRLYDTLPIEFKI